MTNGSPSGLWARFIQFTSSLSPWLCGGTSAKHWEPRAAATMGFGQDQGLVARGRGRTASTKPRAPCSLSSFRHVNARWRGCPGFFCWRGAEVEESWAKTTWWPPAHGQAARVGWTATAQRQSAVREHSHGGHFKLPKREQEDTCQTVAAQELFVTCRLSLPSPRTGRNKQGYTRNPALHGLCIRSVEQRTWSTASYLPACKGLSSYLYLRFISLFIETQTVNLNTKWQCLWPNFHPHFSKSCFSEVIFNVFIYNCSCEILVQL